MTEKRSSAQDYRSRGYAIIPNSVGEEQQKCRERIDALIKDYFLDSEDKWESLTSEEFHHYTYDCQRRIIDTGFQDIFIEDNLTEIEALTGMEDVYHESTIFLRAIRPKSKGVVDNLGFHRETMFTDYPSQTSKAHNIWIPLTLPNEQTAVRLLPGSNLIPDSDLSWSVDDKASRVERGSYGHKLGMLYKPKKIDNIPDIRSVPIAPSLDEFCLFSAMTIHGAGINSSNQIRLSLTMATIDGSAIVDNKSYTASGGLPHYVPLKRLSEDNGLK